MTVNIDATSGSEAIKIGGVDAVTFDTNGIKTGLGSAFAGAIHGLTLSNGTDADHDIDIAVGGARDAADIYTMNLSSGLTKQIDAGFAAGTNAGGLFSGTVAIDTWYHTFLIKKDSDGTIDAGFDTSVTAANIPAGYTAYRRIGSVLTDGSSNILGFHQDSNDFHFDTPVQDHSAAFPTGARSSITVSTPLGVETKANIAVSQTEASDNIVYVYVSSLNQPDVAPSASVWNMRFDDYRTGSWHGDMLNVYTDVSSQIGLRSTLAYAGTINTNGWEDKRGQN